MPLLRDYRCTACDSVSEHWDKQDELATHECPHCGATQLKRMISPSNLNYTDMAANGEASSDAMGTAVDKWHKMRMQKMKIEQRDNERHGSAE